MVANLCLQRRSLQIFKFALITCIRQGNQSGVQTIFQKFAKSCIARFTTRVMERRKSGIFCTFNLAYQIICYMSIAVSKSLVILGRYTI